MLCDHEGKNIYSFGVIRNTIESIIARVNSMDLNKLFNLYEKQYYHEIEARDKLNSRLQIPLSVLIAVLGFLSFILQNKPFFTDGFWSISFLVFYVFYTFAGISTIFAIFFFRKAWFGHTDKLLPTAEQSEEYRKEMIELYSEYEKTDELVNAGMRKYLFNYYVEFSSINSTNNDSRSYNLYKMTVALTIATVCSFIAFIPYLIEDIS